MSNIDTDDDYDVLDATPEQGSAWSVGEQITCLISGSTQGWGRPMIDPSRVFTRGDVIAVTEYTLEHRADVLALVDDPTEQIRKWGQQRWHRGHLDVERWMTRGDAVWQVMHDDARAVALAHVDPADRQKAMEQVREKFGVQPQTPSSTFQYTNVAQERRLADDAAMRKAHGRSTIASS